MVRLTLPLLAALVASPALAAEGKWTPQQVLTLEEQALRAQGLTLPPRRLWDPERGTGLLAAAVNVGGCSGAFVSSTGLVVTNHHCVFPIIQEHSTPERNLLAQGFLARSREQELPGKGARIQVPRRFTDVTAPVLAAVPAGADDLARAQALERKQKELVAECERRPATRCQVALFDAGLQYVLVETTELMDVRLVYAPPRAVGEFGGEVDNWTWPRHTGDFALLRAWVAADGSPAPTAPGNVPYTAEHFFPVSTRGVAPGDFVMVLGYPGMTYRALLADEVAERQQRAYPRIIDTLGEFLRLLEEEGRKDEAGRIAVASWQKSLGNRHKNAQGQIAGLRRGRTVEKQRQAEAAVVEWARQRPEHQPALQAREELLALHAQETRLAEREFLLSLSTNGQGPRSVLLAVKVARAALERAKPDLERRPEYMERELPLLREQLERQQKNLFAAADKRVLRALVRRAQALGPEARIAAVDAHFGRSYSERQVARKVDTLYARTRVLDAGERRKMFGESVPALRARKDPLLELGFALAEELAALDELGDRRRGASARLRPVWRRAVLAHAGRPVAPDANGTLRVSFARVVGYRPRDGVLYEPQTTLSGMLAKDTGQEPFDVPPRVREAAEARRFGSWVDPRLGEVPVAFLSDADTTGGNSGSPTVNGQGELVGVNFDRVWENVANDFGYNPEVARNVNADVRYMLWLLEQVEGGQELLQELGVRRPTAVEGR
jgi:hypothetical protein